MKRIGIILILLVIVGAIGGTLYFLWDKSKEKTVIYKTESPDIINVIKKAVATGSIVPRKEIEIKPQVSGIVEKIYVEPGQMIKKGGMIAKVKIIPNMVNLNNAEGRVNKAKIVFENAGLEFKRNQDLYSKKVIAEADFLQAQLTYDNAKAELTLAEDNLQLIKEGVTSRSKNVTNTLIKSTINGMVLDVPIEEGNSVIESNTFNAGSTIAIIANMGEMIFEGKVDETEVGKITEGMDLIVSIGAIEDHKFKAILEYISPKGVEENGAIQFEIKAAMEISDEYFIRAGYSANADIVLERKDSVLAIKESLILFIDDSTFVEIETETQVFERILIKTGLSDGINIEVLEGVEKDAKIKVQEAYGIEEED
ncbi:MAG: efflux RND transporter periplasmic adaptor subunit [Bacteroidetes bacterium]|nr:efflux RND transporter periplasmic adaptor subunit [Bacteroidota bacterium]